MAIAVRSDLAGPGRIAEPETRVEGPLKVTGRARYAADFAPVGTLWLAYVRSPHAHARILSVDASAARAADGVHTVLTGADLPPTARFGRVLQDYPILARERVRFIGDRVAAVAAETRQQAEAAAALVEVEYEDLPAIHSYEDALQEDAPVLHPVEDAEQYVFLAGKRQMPAHPNIQGRQVQTTGTDEERAAAFQNAYRVFEHRFRTPRQHQGHLEPHACLVWLDDDGTVHVMTTSKAPFALRDQLAGATGLSKEQIVVHAEYIGGDFGGKGLTFDESTCYFMARATGRPVKAVMTYADELGAGNPRHTAVMTLRTAVDQEGHFLAHETVSWQDGGAYAAGKGLPNMVVPSHHTLPCYHIPQARFEVTAVYTNNVPGGHMRSPGDPQALFAGESHVDLIALEMGIDPIELRLRNVVREGVPNALGHAFVQPRAVEVLEKLRQESHWDQPLAPNRGRGVAIGEHPIGGGRTTVKVRLLADGSVEVVTGASEQGVGTHTTMQRVAAHTLNVAPERVRVRYANTAEAELDPGIGGSRTTNVMGGAARAGAETLRQRLEELAAEVLGWPAGKVKLEGDAFHDDAGNSLPFVEVAARIAQGGPVEVTGSNSAGEAGVPNADFAAYAVEVELDRDTGQVTILDVLLVGDVGTIINPVAHQGQLNGGFVFGLGGAVMEDLAVEEGKVSTLSLGEYKLPTSVDVPPFRVEFLTSQPGTGPFGAKSVGELTNITVGPAVANAVAAAGARVMELPVTSERVLAALRGGTDA